MATQAQAAITAGAKVIGLTSLERPRRRHREDRGAAGVKTLTTTLNLGGSASVYVSFNNVHVASSRVKALWLDREWHVKNPHVFELDGSPTDNNATLFAQGYNSVLKSYYADGKYKKVGEQAVLPGTTCRVAPSLPRLSRRTRTSTLPCGNEAWTTLSSPT